jgi:outer membrane protein
MKRLAALALVTMALVLGTNKIAEAQKASAATKIGYVDLEKALNDVEDGKKAKEKLKATFEEKQKTLDKKTEEFKKKKEEYDKRAPLLKPEAKEKEQRELEKQFIELQALAQQLQLDLSQEEAKLTKPIFDRFAKILRTMGESGGYALILEKNQSAILYAPDAMDLTSELVRNYNDGKGK